MKRSDMVEKVAAEFQERTMYNQGYSYEELAKEFLKLFEEFGMFPPKRPLTKEELEAYKKLNKTPKSYSYSWEPEDD